MILDPATFDAPLPDATLRDGAGQAAVGASDSQSEAVKAQRETAALLLASGHPLPVVARRVGRDKRTLYRWLEKSDFRSRVSDYRTHLFDRATDRLSARAQRAAFKLCRLLESEDEDVQLCACKAVLDQAVKLRQLTELVEELADVKECLADLKHGEERACSSGVADSSPAPVAMTPSQDVLHLAALLADATRNQSLPPDKSLEASCICGTILDQLEQVGQVPLGAGLSHLVPRIRGLVERARPAVRTTEDRDLLARLATMISPTSLLEENDDDREWGTA